MRARRNGDHVVGADRDDAGLEAALEIGAIDAATSADNLANDVDVLVIATHLEPTLREIARLAREGTRALLIVDVASVKAPVAAAARGLKNFVATHPMAGTERSGVRAARADLFEGRTWAYVPSGDTELDRRAEGFIASLGALPVAMSAREHDAIVALTSHLPQIVGSCYGSALLGAGARAELLYGPVARELSRISTMGFEMWRDVLLANAANLEPELRRFAGDLERVAAVLAAGDADALADFFSKAETGGEATRNR